MALIRCPQCGEKISDQAVQCVHCGYQLKNGQHICRDCGAVLTGNDGVCPNCGCPVDDTSIEPGRKHRFRYVKIIAVIAVLVYFVYGVYQYNYSMAYSKVVDQIYDARNAGVDAVNACSALLMDVWGNAIWKIQDPETDPFTCPGGVFVNDFNDALDSLYSDEDFCEKLKLLDEKQQELRMLKREIQNPPKDYEDYNECLLQMVNNWIKISMTILNPSGSYDDLNQQFHDLFDESHELIRELDTY